MGLIQILPVTRRRHGTYDDDSESRRQCTMSYTVPDGKGGLQKVCKQTFMKIFAITPQRITTIVKKKKSGDYMYTDKRGGAKMFKFTVHDRRLVKQHINSFPRDVSHYNRLKSDKEYLSSDLNVHRLFRAFQEKNPCNISHKFYRSVFLKDFPNLSFRRPRVDTCKTCDQLSISTKSSDPATKKTGTTKLELHHRQVEAVFASIKSDFIRSPLPVSDTCTITMDLQKVFSLPKLTHSSMYYSRQISGYNFGIHVADTDDGLMCIWHEGQSGRGGNQMASCLLQTLNCTTQYIQKNLCVSDNCAGQLKNRMLLFLYIFLVCHEVFETIDHKFLVSGHSFSASDRDFALIEKRTRQCKLINMQDVMKAIVTARPSRPYKVLNMGDEKTFFDFDAASSAFLNTAKLGISTAVWIRVSKDNPGTVMYKKSYSDLAPWESCIVLKLGITATTIKNATLSSLPNSLPLKESKKKDITAMLQFLDDDNKQYFLNILTV
ncbi:LOW QUALITY PROTEIN: uncharacterized protein [Diabrotica undecimpunctata]|uniref:LOW QUALITY PROTEIN: uncharacterized protein n=1 Tax=Diabrotica undecimpunctata TaxID=50387 RepID=UPI003B63A019